MYVEPSFCMERMNGMVKERKLAIPYTTIFIAQLPEGTRKIIRKDLEQYAHERYEKLEWDAEAQDYAGLAGRFCDVEDIYRDVDLIFCEPGEDVAAYKKSLKRNITLKLEDGDVDALCRMAGKNGLRVTEILEAFIADFIGSNHSHGSDERMLARQWFDRCLFEQENTFLSYLLCNGEIEQVIEAWNDLKSYQSRKELDEYDREEMNDLERDMGEWFKDYRENTYRAADVSIDAAMEKVMDWKLEKDSIKGEDREQVQINQSILKERGKK